MGKTHVYKISLKVPLSTQVYKWVLVNLMFGVTLQWTSIPSRGLGAGGSRNAPNSFMLCKLEISTGLMGLWASVCSLTNLIVSITYK